MDLIAHWLKDEQGLQQELHDAMLAIGQQLNETPEAEQWPLRQWQRWLEENGLDLALLQQALLQLFTNAGEAEPYAAIHQELNQQPGDGPGIERLLNCAEQHSEALFAQLLEQLEAEAKETEALLQTSGGSSSSHHKLAQNMSNHRTAWSAGGGTVGAVVLGGLGIWAYRTHNAKQELNNAINEAQDLGLQEHPNYTDAQEATKFWLPSNIRAAKQKLDAVSSLTETMNKAKNLNLEPHKDFIAAENAINGKWEPSEFHAAKEKLETTTTLEERFKAGEREFTPDEIIHLSEKTRAKLFIEGKVPTDLTLDHGERDEVLFQHLTKHHQGNLRREGKWTEMDDIYASRVADIDPYKYLQTFESWKKNPEGKILNNRGNVTKEKIEIFTDNQLTETGKTIFGASEEEFRSKKPSPGESLNAYHKIDEIDSDTRSRFEESEAFKDLTFASNIQHDGVGRLDAGGIQHTYWEDLKAGWKIIYRDSKPEYFKEIPYKEIKKALGSISPEEPESVSFKIRQGTNPGKFIGLIDGVENDTNTFADFCDGELNKILAGNNKDELGIFKRALNSSIESLVKSQLDGGKSLRDDQRALKKLLDKIDLNTHNLPETQRETIRWIRKKINIIPQFAMKEIMEPVKKFIGLENKRFDGLPYDEKAHKEECEKLKDYKLPTMRDARLKIDEINKKLKQDLIENIQKEREAFSQNLNASVEKTKDNLPNQAASEVDDAKRGVMNTEEKVDNVLI